MKKTKNNYPVTESYLSGGGRMSTPERLFQNEGFLLLTELLPDGVFIEAMVYEWLTFNLPGGKYTPDFGLICTDNSWIFVEVKQETVSKRSGRVFRGQSYRDSRSKLRAAASLNPWCKFYMAAYSRGGWRLEYIEPTEFIYPSSMKVEEENAPPIDQS